MGKYSFSKCKDKINRWYIKVNPWMKAGIKMQKKLLLSEYVLLSLMAIFYILIFSTTTSPFWGEPFAGDSAMFQTIGKYWAKGHLPYVSLWDSKGPIIFFINAIGYFLTDSNLGVFFYRLLD